MQKKYQGVFCFKSRKSINRAIEGKEIYISKINFLILQIFLKSNFFEYSWREKEENVE